MNGKQLKKYSALTTASVMTLQLAACNIAEDTYNNDNTSPKVEINDDVIKPDQQENEITQSIQDDGEDLKSVFNSEFANACEDWEIEEDGSFECIDEDSDLYSQYFFNGVMFATLAAMTGNSMYKAHNLKKDKKSSANSSSSSSSIIKPGTSNNSTTTSGSSNASTSTNTNTNTNSKSIDGVKKNTTSNGNTTSNSSSSSSSSSYSSGKKGFSSGGASRGGSASS